jgi:hypothetical protein
MKAAYLMTALAAGALSAQAAAQDSVSATDPASLAQAMKYAGFAAELTTDQTGDPMIKTSFDGYTGAVFFYDCSETSHDGCQAIQFNAGLDRKQPMSPVAALELAKKYRFAAVHLDDEGDPYVGWDVLTGDGISREVFLLALRRYSATLDDIADEVFAEERGQ